jgi:hypothetical protein
MSLKIVMKLSGTHDNYIPNLFHLQIVFLGSCQDLQHKIYMELLLQYFNIFCDLLLDDKSSANCRVHGGDL